MPLTIQELARRLEGRVEGDGTVVEGSFDGTEACIVSKSIGSGRVIYCGTNLGEGALRGADYLEACLRRVLTEFGVSPTLDAAPEHPGTVHLDALLDGDEPAFIVALSRAPEPQKLRLSLDGCWRGLCTRAEWSAAGNVEVELPGRFADILLRGQEGQADEPLIS